MTPARTDAGLPALPPVEGERRQGDDRSRPAAAGDQGQLAEGIARPERLQVDLVPLHTKIGQQALEIDFLERALTKAGLLSAGK